MVFLKLSTNLIHCPFQNSVPERTVQYSTIETCHTPPTSHENQNKKRTDARTRPSRRRGSERRSAADTRRMASARRTPADGIFRWRSIGNPHGRPAAPARVDVRRGRARHRRPARGGERGPEDGRGASCGVSGRSTSRRDGNKARAAQRRCLRRRRPTCDGSSRDRGCCSRRPPPATSGGPAAAGERTLAALIDGAAHDAAFMQGLKRLLRLEQRSLLWYGRELPSFYFERLKERFRAALHSSSPGGGDAGAREALTFLEKECGKRPRMMSSKSMVRLAYELWHLASIL